MIEVIDLVKDYRSTDGAVVHAVDGISFEVAPGEFIDSDELAQVFGYQNENKHASKL